jgi:hypothetical protein
MSGCVQHISQLRGGDGSLITKATQESAGPVSHLLIIATEQVAQFSYIGRGGWTEVFQGRDDPLLQLVIVPIQTFDQWYGSRLSRRAESGQFLRRGQSLGSIFPAQLLGQLLDVIHFLRTPFASM